MANFDDLIGIPFAYKGRGPKEYDCYGLLRELYKRDGIKLPDYDSPEDGARITAVFALELRLWEFCEPQAGVAALIRVPGNLHCAYMLNQNYMLHTWQKSGGVTRERIDAWRPRIMGYYRYVG